MLHGVTLCVCSCAQLQLQVFGGTEATGEDDSIVTADVQLTQVTDVAPSDAC